jgi:ribosomal protein S18 acetylase RimI-like enzyme
VPGSGASAPALVRIADPADLDAIAEIHVRARATYYRGRIPDGQLDDPDEHARWRAGWARAIDASDRTVLCAERSGLVVGIASLGPPHDATTDPRMVGELYQLHVRPGLWSHGIGSILHDACVAVWREASIATGRLEVYEHNVRALAFYTRHGWRPDPGQDQVPGPGHRAEGPVHIRMRLDVSPPPAAP